MTPNSISKENESINNATVAFTESNFCQKSISTNMSQLSIDSAKSTDALYDISVREPSVGSPVRSVHEKTGVYNLIWPEPKTIIELGNISPPFIAGKELFISIIQVINYFN